MDRVRTPFVIVLALFAGCTAPVAQPSARPAPPTTAARQQATPLAQVTVKSVVNPALGMILIDAKRMTLYRYTGDPPNASYCYDQCADNWPPLLVSTGKPYLAGDVAGRLGTITRADGGQQVTYESMPLYRWVDDVKPGETTGQGVDGVWYVVQPVQAARAGGAPRR